MGNTFVSLMTEIPVDSIEGEQGWIHVFPLGNFTARDGRPGSLGVPAQTWTLTVSGAQEVIRRWEERKTPVVIDYEHQTYEARDNGQPAPAAGWIRRLVLREHGMFAGVEWTPRAKEYIRAGEYKYISPTFLFDVNSGEVLELCSAALTNTPALDGMEPVQAKEHTPVAIRFHDISESTIHTQHEPKRGVPLVQNTHEQTRSGLLGAKTAYMEQSANTFLEGLVKHVVQEPMVTERLKRSKKETRSPHVLRERPHGSSEQCSELMGLYQDAQKQVSMLKEQIQAFERKEERIHIEQAIDVALQDGRLQQSCERWARSCAVSYPEVIQTFLKVATPLAALVSMQTRQLPGVGQSGYEPSDVLSTEENHVRSQLGMSVETFIKHKKECQ